MRFTVRIAAVTLILVIALSLSGCGKYDESFIIGKTSLEISERYGEFDYLEYKDNDGYSQEDGIYRNCKLGYATKTEKGVAVEYFAISFDKDGIAYRVEKNYEPPKD